MTKISKTHHVTKDGKVKRNPKKKMFYLEDGFNLDVWTDDDVYDVLGYFAYIINKLPKNLKEVELNDVVKDDNMINVRSSFNQKSHINTNGKHHYSVNYLVNGYAHSKPDFISYLKNAKHIINKYGVSFSQYVVVIQVPESNKRYTEVQLDNMRVEVELED